MTSSSTYAFVIVGPDDSPAYTADLSAGSGGARQRSDEQQHLYQFVLQASLDVVQEAVWSSQNMFLKVRGWGWGAAHTGTRPLSLSLYMCVYKSLAASCTFAPV